MSKKAHAQAKQLGSAAGVSWSEIAAMCGFSTIAQVNRALRLTGSRRVIDGLASPADTETLLKCCVQKDLNIPDEGRFSPLTELAMIQFLTQAGCKDASFADSFGISLRTEKVKTLAAPIPVNAAEITSPDGSVFITIYTDYHYMLICQNAESRTAANPADHFEGFFADEATSDLWGVGDLS